MWKPLLTLLALTQGTSALPKPQGGPGGGFSNTGPTTGGTGPYAPANYTTTPTLPNHTLYLPSTPPTNTTLPVLIWGNGACLADGTAFLSLLTQLASHGIFVIASGRPGGSGQTTAALMEEALDWVAQTGRDEYAFVEEGRVAVAGQSCGGVEAYQVAGDERVGALGVFNSGLLSVAEAERLVPGIGGKPVFYFLGGEGDVAFVNGERDYDLLTAGTPSWKGNLDVGHGGTYRETDAGKFGVAAVHFFDWVLRGNAEAASFFTGGGAEEAGWVVESKDLDAINVTPI